MSLAAQIVNFLAVYMFRSQDQVLSGYWSDSFCMLCHEPTVRYAIV
jgi:hypothetical protein